MSKNTIDETWEDNTTHYERTCMFCGYTWLGLHCPHDGYQNECSNCKRRPNVIDYHNCTCEGVTDFEDISQALYQDLIDCLPVYNSKTSRSYFQPNSDPAKAHKNGHRLAVREMEAKLKQYFGKDE